jgi:hypothetical protein
VSSSVDPNPRKGPDSGGPPPDDPKKFPSWLHLGTLIVDPSGTITSVRNEGRFYTGVLAQRIVAPSDATSKFDVLQKNSALDPLASIAFKDNVFVEQNLIAGPDFKVEPEQIKPTPAKPFPSVTGNVKVANDLFLQGNLYTHGDPATPSLWSSLNECIQRQIKNVIPELQLGTTKAPLTFPVASRVDATGSLVATVDVMVTTQMGKVASTSVIASLAGIQYQPKSSIIVPQNAGTRPPTAEATGDVNGFHLEVAGKITPESDKNFRVTLTCTAGPAQQISVTPAAYEAPVASVLISYLVIFYPAV